MRTLLLALLLGACTGTVTVDDKAGDTDTAVADSDTAGDDSGADSPADTGGDSGDSGATDSGDSGDSGAGDSGAGDSGSAGSNGCTDPADVSALGTAAATIGSVSQTCALQCATSGMIRSCVATCVANELGISQGCADCFGVYTTCIVGQCALACLNPTSQGCVTCRTNKCDPAFETCAGIALP
ncbi:MAG: hypothetical protein H6732_14465 [Alphaproteobacteria bacterium]|nr:hypothetical protein [Alphaproteobacteria bacterium]